MEEDTPAAIHPLALKIQKLFNKDLVEEYEFLRAQLEVAVEIRGKRYQFTDQQRGTLVKYGEPVKGHLDELCKLMKPETLLRWHRDQKRKKWDYSGRPRKKVGRPPIGTPSPISSPTRANAPLSGSCRMPIAMKFREFIEKQDPTMRKTHGPRHRMGGQVNVSLTRLRLASCRGKPPRLHRIRIESVAVFSDILTMGVPWVLGATPGE